MSRKKLHQRFFLQRGRLRGEGDYSLIDRTMDTSTGLSNYTMPFGSVLFDELAGPS